MSFNRTLVQESFNWRAQWYPVAVVDDLDPARPHATKLLGQYAYPLSWPLCIPYNSIKQLCTILCR